MNNLFRDFIILAGFGLLVSGIALYWGFEIAMMAGGVIMMVSGLMMGVKR